MEQVREAQHRANSATTHTLEQGVPKAFSEPLWQRLIPSFHRGTLNAITASVLSVGLVGGAIACCVAGLPWVGAALMGFFLALCIADVIASKCKESSRMTHIEKTVGAIEADCYRHDRLIQEHSECLDAVDQRIIDIEEKLRLLECKCTSYNRSTCEALATVRESLDQIQEFLSGTVRPAIEKGGASQEETNPFAEDLASEEALPPPPPGVLTVSSSMPSLVTPAQHSTMAAQHSTRVTEAPPTPPLRKTPIKPQFVPSSSSIAGAYAAIKRRGIDRREISARLAQQAKEAQSQEKV